MKKISNCKSKQLSIETCSRSNNQSKINLDKQINDGVPLEMIRMKMGHRNLTSTYLYISTNKNIKSILEKEKDNDS